MASEDAAITGSSCPAGATWCRGYFCDRLGDDFGNRWISASLDTLHAATPTSASEIDLDTNRLSSGTYDAAGNLTAYHDINDGGSMAYDANNKMTSFSKTGVSVATRYDAAGRRIRKIYNSETTVWVYDSFGRLAAEYRNGSGAGFSASSPEREYVYFAGKLKAVVEGSEIYYRTTDHLGSTRLVTDSAGDVKQRRDFFPFGENIPADSSHGGRNGVTDGGVATYNASLGVSQQFTGQQRDDESGLDYFWERCFCPELGRFTTVDQGPGLTANPQAWNRYTYVWNNPLTLVDPTGNLPASMFTDTGVVGCTPGPFGAEPGTIDASSNCPPGTIEISTGGRSRSPLAHIARTLDTIAGAIEDFDVSDGLITIYVSEDLYSRLVGVDDAVVIVAAGGVLVAITATVITIDVIAARVAEAWRTWTQEKFDRDLEDCQKLQLPDFDDPTVAPGPDWTWRAKPGVAPGTGPGSWVRGDRLKRTLETLYPNFDHEEGIDPHWDYTGKNGNSFRKFRDGHCEPK